MLEEHAAGDPVEELEKAGWRPYYDRGLTFSNYAMAWIRAGFATFPVTRSTGNTPRSNPSLLGGFKVDFDAFKRGSMPPSDIAEWYSRNALSDVAVLLGERSAGAFVIHVNAPRTWLAQAAAAAIEAALGPAFVRSFTDVIHDARYGLLPVERLAMFYRADARITARTLRPILPHFVEVVVQADGHTVVSGEVANGGGCSVRWPGGQPASASDLIVVDADAVEQALEAVAQLDAMALRARYEADQAALEAEDEPDPIRDFLATDGAQMRSLGWNVAPQERDERRTTSAIDGYGLKWGPLQTRFSTDLEFAKWADQAATANVAISLGATSGDVMVFDVDVLDPVLAEAVVKLIEEICGSTPLARIGRAPKVMLFYRLHDRAGRNLKKRQYDFAKLDDLSAKSGDVVEVIFERALATASGLHHKTRREITWPRLSPLQVGPEAATEISFEQFEEVARRLPEVRALVETKRAAPTFDVTALPASAGDKILSVPVSGNWNTVSGKIVDGREKFLALTVFEIVRANPAAEYTASDVDQIAKMAFDVFKDRAELSGRWSADSYIWNEAYARAVRNCTQMSAGDVTPNHRVIKAARAAQAGETTTVEQAPKRQPLGPIERHGEQVGPLSWISPRAYDPDARAREAEKAGLKVRRSFPIVIQPAPAALDAIRADLALRDEIKQRSAWAEIKRSIDRAALDFEVSIREGKDGDSLILVKAPTGAGKTTQIVLKIMAELRERPWADGVRIAFLVPSRENAADIAKLVEADCANARKIGHPTPGGVRYCGDSIDPIAPIAGPKLGIYKGKGSAFLDGGRVCSRPEELDAMIQADMSTETLCEVVPEEDPNNPSAKLKEKLRRQKVQEERRLKGLPKERFTRNTEEGLKPIQCQFLADKLCKFHNQAKLFADCSIIIASHYYLKAKAVPQILRNCAAVIVDEDPSLGMVKGHYVELRLLGSLPIIDPLPSEQARGITRDILNDRSSLAARIAREALRAGRDPAADLMDRDDCDDLVHAAKAVSTRSRTTQIDPTWMKANIVMEAKARVAARKKTPFDKAPQGVFWRVIEDRIQRLRDGTAKGSTDARLQLVWREREGETGLKEHIRVSWRSKANFEGKPIMVLAAGGRARVLEKLFGRRVDVREIKAALQLKIAAAVDSQFANSSFLPADDDTAADKARKLALVRKVRLAITRTAALHGRAKILVVATKAVATYLNAGCWSAPENVAWGWFGGLAGLDFAKNYPCVMTIGRSEMPLQDVDALVAALTFDDDEPEAPVDVHGTGTKDGAPLRSDKKNALHRPKEFRSQRMRSGETVRRMVPALVEGWAAEVEAIWREGEILQAAGRVRPVYKTSENAPTWICLSASLPAEFVVDRLFWLDDYVADAGLFEAQRLIGGALSEDVSFWPDVVFEKAGEPGSLQEALDTLAQQAREMFLASCSTATIAGKRAYLIAGWATPQDAIARFRSEVPDAPQPDAFQAVEVLPLQGRNRPHRFTFEQRRKREIDAMRARWRTGAEFTVDEEDAIADAVAAAEALAAWRWDLYSQLGATEEMLAAVHDVDTLAELADIEEWDQAARNLETELKSQPAAPIEVVEVAAPITMIEAPAIAGGFDADDDDDLMWIAGPQWRWLSPPVHASG